VGAVLAYIRLSGCFDQYKFTPRWLKKNKDGVQQTEQKDDATVQKDTAYVQNVNIEAEVVTDNKPTEEV